MLRYASWQEVDLWDRDGMTTGSLKVLSTLLGSFVSRDFVTSDGSSSEKTDNVFFSLCREGE